jgi:glycosyltransferase involved in cell wall biosynthesis
MLFAAGGDIGGGKTHILSLARELSKDNELRLVSFRREVLSREAREMGIDVADIDAKEGMKAAFRFALQQADEYRPQLIHCHGSKANMFGVMIKALRHIPVITTVHSDPRLDYMGAPLRKYTYGLINAFALRCMDFHVAVANRMKETLIERHFDPQRIFTIFNGMDFSQADPGPRAIREDQEEIWIGIAARLNPVKDIGTVIRAFDIAYKQDKRLRLSIAGIGEDEKALKAQAEALGLTDVIRFEGWISDAKAYFRRIDINVLS